MEGKQYSWSDWKIVVPVAFFIASLLILAAMYTLASRGNQEVQVVVIHEGQHREGIAHTIAQALGWSQEKEEAFLFALTSIQWDALNEELAGYIGEHYDWSRQNRELFLVRANKMLSTQDDPLAYAFVPGGYKVSEDERPAFIAERIVDNIKKAYPESREAFFSTAVSPQALERANALAHADLLEQKTPEGTASGTSTAPNLLPDIVVLPPQDIAIRYEGEQIRLVFSTTYYNIGAGPLELIGDPEMRGIEEDHDRNVFQRIYRSDDTYYDTLIGTFHWHQEHLHYHYSDFIDYILEPSGVVKGSAETGAGHQKLTYCVRDVTRINTEEEVGLPAPRLRQADEAAYRICSKEVQGVSVGWGDTYFHTYGDQFFDITDVPSGTYRITFHANPTGWITERKTGNNTSSAVFTIDKDAGTVDIIDYVPEEFPDFEHVHVKQDL